MVTDYIINKALSILGLKELCKDHLTENERKACKQIIQMASLLTEEEKLKLNQMAANASIWLSTDTVDLYNERTKKYIRGEEKHTFEEAYRQKLEYQIQLYLYANVDKLNSGDWAISIQINPYEPTILIDAIRELGYISEYNKASGYLHKETRMHLRFKNGLKVEFSRDAVYAQYIGEESVQSLWKKEEKEYKINQA